MPHSWFAHYYILSVALSLFWLFQLLFKGRAFQAIALYVPWGAETPSMSTAQVFLLWGCLLLQGVRRWAESVVFMKKSQSRMPWTIYALGFMFYLFVNVAVWIEGTSKPVTPISRTL